MKKSSLFYIGTAIVILIIIIWWNTNQFEIPKGETIPLNSEVSSDGSSNEDENSMKNDETEIESLEPTSSKENFSEREIFVTDNVLHSIPLSEILKGGPPKDGIPSIDDPKFIKADEADFLEDSDVGLGLTINGVQKFYPYLILVWHEIVNDKDVLVTYCPLCATGIAFNPNVDGKQSEFGVSGKLWQSNLLMYNRTGDEDTESLWSQVLGEAVLGKATGAKLDIIPSDTVLFGDWKSKHPNTLVLSKDTGSLRTYGLDPYGDYYTNEDVSFGASFNDNRTHPKTFVLGIEIDGKYKAYNKEKLPEGTTSDSFSGKQIIIEKDDIGGVRIFVQPEKVSIPYVGGFWFSWLAVHPDTQLY